MQFLKNKKLVFNILIVVLTIIPFILLFGNYIELYGGHGLPYINYFDCFMHKAGSEVVASYVYLILICVNIFLTLYVLIFQIVTKKYSKSLQNLTIFPIIALFNVGIIVISFLLGPLNNISKIMTIIPFMIAMICFLNLLFITIRILLEVEILKK